MTDYVAPTSLFDPTGKTDISDALAAWINRAPNGTSVTDMTRAVIPPGTYLVEGGLAGQVTLGEKKNISLETPGATFVQHTKKPFVVKADTTNVGGNPAGQWNITYTPTNSIKTAVSGWLAGSPAFDRATAKCRLLNRSRSFVRLRKCQQVRLRGLTLVGGAGLDPVYNDDYEAQNGINNHGSRNIELDDCDVRSMWGNGLEANYYGEDDGTYVAPLGMWVHDSGFTDFGRQAASLTYGGRFIYERCDLAGSLNGRSLIDMEPTTDRNDPALGATVEGTYVLSCNIGKHRLGMIASGLTHGDVRWIRVSGCRGLGIGTSGVSFAQGVIFEDNVDTDTDSSPSAFDFVRGPSWGGKNIIVRRNKNFYLSSSGVQFHDGGASGGCVNYLVTGNDFRGRGPMSGAVMQFIDNNNPPWLGKFFPFELPVPAHPLRDL